MISSTIVVQLKDKWTFKPQLLSIPALKSGLTEERHRQKRLLKVICFGKEYDISFRLAVNILINSV
jgi:hypothetical protein